MIVCRRPSYRLDLLLERHLGHAPSRHVEKCRRNMVLPLVGQALLVALWLLVILSADYKDNAMVGSITVVMAVVYSGFSIYQEVVTSTENHAIWLTFLQRHLPLPFAPDYNPETMRTVQEGSAHFPHHQILHLHHRWRLQLNQLDAMPTTEALIKVFCGEMKRLEENNGTNEQRGYVQDAFKSFLSRLPRVQIKGNGLESVTLAAEGPLGQELAKFFLVPGFDVFKTSEFEDPEVMEEKIRDYCIVREEAHRQAVFINSCSLFNHFGDRVVR
uniref:HECT domain-containing protein n=1 Tax=Caenorhabditis tropicalis TaxID=1561998 RepID=A0A1I7V0W3_9PELO